MIKKLIQSLLGRKSAPPPPVQLGDLFGGTDASAYDGDAERSSSSIVIAPRSADADLAKLEAPLAASSTPETEQLLLSGHRPNTAKTAAKPPGENRGWDNLTFGD